MVLPGYRQGWDPLLERAWVTHGLHSYRRLVVEHPDPASDPMLPLVRATQTPNAWLCQERKMSAVVVDVLKLYPWTPGQTDTQLPVELSWADRHTIPS